MNRTILSPPPHAFTVDFLLAPETFLPPKHLTSNAGFPIPEPGFWLRPILADCQFPCQVWVPLDTRRIAP